MLTREDWNRLTRIIKKAMLARKKQQRLLSRSRIGMRGHLCLELRGADGRLKAVREVDNLVVTTGLEFLAACDSDAPATPMGWMAVGTGAVAPAAGDTTLGSELARVALTTKTQTTVNNAYVATFSPGTGTGALTEAGIFNAAGAGTMLSRLTYAVINKSADDTLLATWTITFSAP